VSALDVIWGLYGQALNLPVHAPEYGIKENNMKRFFLVLTVFLAFLITGCDDNPTDGDKCENACTTAGVNECSDDKVMVCQQDEDGCLVLTEVETCENGCEGGACISVECDPACEEWQTCNNGVCETGENRCADNNDCTAGKVCDENHNCVDESVECDPACEEWQTCNNTVCETSEGRCNDNNDCEDGKVCDETHNCVVEEVKKKTKVVIGAGKKVSSSSFKMRLNVGKVTSTKDVKSENYKMKVGTSVIYK
jgi:hypothetical protein